MIYKKVIRKTGAVNYFKDGKYIKQDAWDILPQEVLDMAEGEIKIKNPEPVVIKDERVSIISGEPGTKQRYVNGQTYWLTDEEYKTCTLGSIVSAASKLDTCEIV